MTTKTIGYELVIGEWLGTPDSCAPEGYSMFPYLDLAWAACGGSGDCPETFTDEALARRVAGAIREDQHGVMPRVTVRRHG
jgi:hypothetical protein